MKAKKVAALLLAGTLMIGALAGCGGDSGSSTASKGGDSSKTSSTGGETSNTGAKSDASLEIWLYGWEKASADKMKVYAFRLLRSALLSPVRVFRAFSPSL